MTNHIPQFSKVWFVDFEFHAPRGERQDPLCLVAHELYSGKRLKLWRDDFGAFPPYSTGKDSLFVAYYASAELGCHLFLDWPIPKNVLDLYVEFRNLTNGLLPRKGANLLGALAYYNIPHIEVHKKDVMRDLAIRGGPFTEKEKKDLLDYCETDVVALGHLYSTMLGKIDFPRALLRGRYMAASARMEYTGIPVDQDNFGTLHKHWGTIQDSLIPEIDKAYGVFEGPTFKSEKFREYLTKHSIAWPRLDSGNLDMSKDTFKDMARSYPQLRALHELRTRAKINSHFSLD